jgi:hypothetical protein
MKYLIIVITILIFYGCAHTIVPIIFEPVSVPNVSTIYSNGVPLASSSIDNVSFLLSLDQTEISGNEYFRLWVLFQNESDSTMLLEPSKIFSIIAIPKKASGIGQEFTMQAQSPTIILNKVENAEALRSIMTAIGGTLEAVSAKNTTVTSNHGDRYEINDASEKRDKINERTSSSLVSISNWYSIYKSSISSGILRKNTLFKDQSINGYLYFRNNMRVLSESKRYFNECNPADFDYKVLVQLPSGIKTIEFKITQGE